MSKKKLIKNRYNSESYVSTYDNRYHLLQFDKFELICERIQMIEGIILDFGCGTGLLWDFLNQIEKKKKNRTYQLEINSNTIFVGIDLSIEMLRSFKQKLIILKNQMNKNNEFSIIEKNNFNVHPQKVNLICCDGENLPFRSQQFNLVFTITTLQNLPDPSLGLKEINRIRNKNSKIGLSFLRKSINKEELTKILIQNIGKPQSLEFFDKINNLKGEDWICIIES